MQSSVDLTGIPVHPHDITAVEIRDILGKDDPFIIEIGAADGQTTEQFLEAMPRARITCFEPDPRPLAVLQRKFPEGHPQVGTHGIALSNEAAITSFHQSGGCIPHSTEPCREDWYLSGSIQKPTGHLARDPWVKFPSTIRIATVTLDWYLSELPDGVDIDLCWMDVQGAEARVILGGQNTLRRTRWLYTEFYDEPQYERQPDLKGILSFLPDFDLVAVYADNALLRNRGFDEQSS